MQEPYVEEEVAPMAEALRGTVADELCLQLFRLLAEGRPVPIERIADTLARPLNGVARAARRLPNVEFDRAGNVLGQGITREADER